MKSLLSRLSLAMALVLIGAGLLLAFALQDFPRRLVEDYVVSRLQHDADLIYVRVLDALDPEGDGSPAEHDAERAGRLATWETIGKPAVVQRIENALAEMIPRVVSGVMTGATS